MRWLQLVAAVAAAGCYESTPFDLFDDPFPRGPWPGERAGVWEPFDAGAIDLAGHTVVLTPRGVGAVVAYVPATVAGVDGFPFAPGSGRYSRELALDDDESVLYELRASAGLRFYGASYRAVYVSSNGYLTFGGPDTAIGSTAAEHFRLPSISALRGDLDPSRGGRVVVDEWPGRLVVTWESVPQFGDPATRHDVQATLHADGVVELTYVTLETARPWVVGLANGLAGPVPPAVDLVSSSAPREHCGNGVDDDGDGAVDCDDRDCAGDERFCGPFHESDCANGRDDDGDGLVDCDDADCADACWTGREADCANGWDDDRDGLVDCDDPDCAEVWHCQDRETDCGDGRDDDGDGWVDCDDGDCWSAAGCSDGACHGIWERFDEGEDEDLAGAVVQYVPTPEGYRVVAGIGLDGWAIEPGAGGVTTTLALGDDEAVAYDLVLLEGFTFFGRRWDRLYVSSNGYLTFGRGSSSLGSDAAELFRLPGVAALRADLDPRRGRVVVDEHDGFLVVVSWDGVPWYSGERPSSFQIVLWDTGEIEVYYVEIATGRGGYVAGVSNGCAAADVPPESDLVVAD